MSSVITQGFGSAILSLQVACPASATKLTDISGLTPPANFQGFSIANNDASATIYVAYGPTMSTTNWDRALAPSNPSLEVVARGLLNQTYVISSTGTPNMRITYYG